MQKSREIFEVASPGTPKSSEWFFPAPIYPVADHPPKKIKISMRTQRFLVPIAVLCCLVLPTRASAFSFGKMLQSATKTIEHKLTGQTKESVDKKKTKVSEPASPTHSQTQSSAKPGGAGSGPSLFTGFHDAFLGFKFLPELYLSDAVLSRLTQKQIQLESQRWGDIERKQIKVDHDGNIIGKNHIPIFAFSWTDGKKDSRIRKAILRHYLGRKADWSFLNAYGYEGRLDSIIQLFLLPRDKYRDRMPEFAAQGLIPVYRDFLKAVSSRLPTGYYLRAPVTLKYDFKNKEMTFTSAYTKGSPRLSKEIDGYWGTSLPPAAGGTGTIYPASLKGMQYYAPGSDARPLTRLPKAPTDMPGIYGGRYAASGPAARWRDTIFAFGSSSDAPRVLTPRLALDRVLRLDPVKMEPAQAEKILLTLKKSTYPYPNAELQFEVTGAKTAEVYYSGKSKGRFAVLLGKVLKLTIVDHEGTPLFEVPVPLAKDVLQEKEEQQAEAAAQAKVRAKQKEAETETERAHLEKLRMACYTGEPYPWEATSACLKAAKAKVPKDSSGSIRPVGWDFLNQIGEDQRYLGLAQNAFKYELEQACSIGAMRKQRANPGVGSIQALQKDCEEKSPVALKEEKVCRATGPLDKDAQNCLQNHVDLLVNRYYGFAGNQ